MTPPLGLNFSIWIYLSTPVCHSYTSQSAALNRARFAAIALNRARFAEIPRAAKPRPRTARGYVLPR